MFQFNFFFHFSYVLNASLYDSFKTYSIKPMNIKILWVASANYFQHSAVQIYVFIIYQVGI